MTVIRRTRRAARRRAADGGATSRFSTSWEIDDELSVTVADLFYTGLGQGSGTLDPDRAAHALHHAVRSIRDRSSPQAAQDL
ncbi:hypothetical protein [Streptomyces brevispora]|uniref:Uncharacterized protein n=1 Tax=Streptomyces brevispora TaxID=887462 RepID=A0ABZ1FWZ9_9ACTN|nr:hypothetical protein [Streptomyces brevispora]WSC11517.1 hypothetical protein OIE64_00580 [Streptomyces brevispora]WSC17594.1 hypothetical protein OIE64_35460 [Streptomyces brevispora]